MQNPKKTFIDAVLVCGQSVRTSNSLESNPATAQLSSLWARFFAQNTIAKIADRLPQSQDIYGIYTDYASDYNGDYTVIAGVPVQKRPQTLEQGLGTVGIQAGNYLLFEDQGAFPIVVVQLWMKVWAYFQQHPEVKRAYQTDFERYQQTESGFSDRVAIYIGICA